MLSDEDDAEAVDRNILVCMNQQFNGNNSRSNHVYFAFLFLFELQRIVRHPEYSSIRKKNDIALIQFNGTVQFDDIVRPACIRIDTADVPTSQELIIAGWGSVEAGSKRLIQLNLFFSISFDG